MLPARLSACALLMVTIAVTGIGSQGPPLNRPWPPGVQKVPDESPTLSPQQALNTFYMPPGYRLELVASEPLIQDPVAIDWDTDGRLWAVEMPGFMADITGSTEHDPIGRIVVLEDSDGNGRMDKRTVFADGLVLARSVKILDRGVLVAEPPNVWLMHDTNGDLRMDAKELVTRQYGRREADPQNNANGFHWALDNRMYTAGQADIQLRLKNGTFEVQKTLQRGEWGATHDDAGRIYRNTNESALHVDLVPTAYFARNPNLLRTRGSYERLADDASDTDALNVIWPVRPNPGTNRAYQTGIDRSDGSLERFTSVCAPLVYRGDRLPADLYGNVFVAEPAANVVSRLVLSDDGTALRARKAYARGEFLASTDERFRPVYLSNAPDGTLYIVDMYRGIIEHRLSLTMYLRDYIRARTLEQPTGFGRIYRVMHDTTRRDSRSSEGQTLSKASPAQLVEALSSANGWRRDTAQRLLVERFARADGSVVPALVKLAVNAPDPRTRLHALWTLDGIDAISTATVEKALEDVFRDVRVSAIRIAERWLGEANHPIQAAVLQRLGDKDWAVRYQLAATLGTMPAEQRDLAAVALLERHGGDPIAVDAVLSGLRGSETGVLEKMLQTDRPQTPNREAAMTMLAATIVRSAQDAPGQILFGWVADSRRAGWQRTALLRGVEVAWLGASMPGAPIGRRNGGSSATLPCPTCPGGRAGPGGAYAYSKPEDFLMATGRAGGRSGSRAVRLNREPVALLALAAGADALSPRVATLLERVAWPGKPGDRAPIAPLTVEQQQRYDAGRDVYRNICQACHQPDGRGQDRLAPSLVDSPLALATADITARILLNGKEGTFGLMPPIGSTLSDDQLAGVLTYVRREWGQAGTPVDPATVTSVRALTAGRTRPWTNDELTSLAAKGPTSSGGQSAPATPGAGRGAIQTPTGGQGPGAAPEAGHPANADADLSPKPPVLPLDPAEQAKRFWLPPGYRLEPVLSEPLIDSPAQITFDGNGRMFVVELRGYEQTLDGIDSIAPVGRISRHEDRNNDGVFESHTVFVDKLLFPRFAMPLGANTILTMETNADEVWKYTDTTGDGVADKKELFTTNFGRGGNLESQQAALFWALDNWMYSTVNAFRIRWTPTGILREPTGPNGAQWSATQDDDGKVWFQHGASGMPGYFQFPVHYGNFAPPASEQFEPNLNVTWGAPILIGDIQAGLPGTRIPDGSLIYATASAGNEVYRGDRLPQDLVGDYLHGEVVARIVRRLTPVKTGGLTQLRNVYPRSEFIRSLDPLFRPVDIAAAPDGVLYIADLYRGVIEGAPWAMKGTYLRQKIEQYQLDKVLGHGRIWRLTYDGIPRDRTQPRMLNETAVQLVAHLAHPNGWWRDTAQQLLVLKQDRSVVPALERMVRTHGNLLGRFHALWVLEGLGALDPSLTREALRDVNPRMRIQAIRASESLYKAGDKSFAADWRALAGDTDTDVVIQAMLTLNVLKVSDASTAVKAAMASRSARGVQFVGDRIVNSAANAAAGRGGLTPEQQAIMARGAAIYNELCFSCHGDDGRGTPVPGARAGVVMAPSLSGSARVNGHRDYVIKPLLHGMSGPIAGTAYPQVMVPMGSNTDEWIADIASYVRNSFGNSATWVTAAEVAQVRAATASRKSHWTLVELEASLPRPLVPSAGPNATWTVTASHNSSRAAGALDYTRWTSDAPQQPGMWIQIELPQPIMLAEIQFDSPPTGGGRGGAPPTGTFPRGYRVEVSMDGTTWSAPVAEGQGSGRTTVISFAPVRARVVRITQTAATENAPVWSIERLRLYEAATTAFVPAR